MTCWYLTNQPTDLQQTTVNQTDAAFYKSIPAMISFQTLYYNTHNKNKLRAIKLLCIIKIYYDGRGDRIDKNHITML